MGLKEQEDPKEQGDRKESKVQEDLKESKEQEDPKEQGGPKESKAQPHLPTQILAIQDQDKLGFVPLA